MTVSLSSRKRAERRIASPGRTFTGTFSEPEQLLEAYFNASTTGLAILDDKLRYKVINETLAAMNGLPPENHLGKTPKDVLGEQANELEFLLRHVLRTGQPVSEYEFTLKLPTREKPAHWVENFFPLKDENGNATQIGVVAVEITKQKELESAYRDLSLRLLQLQDETLQIANELIDRIQSVVRGGVAKPETTKLDFAGAEGRSSSAASGTIAQITAIPGGQGAKPPLTSREIEVIRFLAEGKANKEIAALLGISRRTAENHRAKIMAKLRVHSLGELVRFAVRAQIVAA